MNSRKPTFPEDSSEEISALIVTLHEAQQRLEVLTEGEVDTVADPDGRAFLLRRSQEQLRLIDAARQAAILNALPAHIALLDTQGLIISVNDAWWKFGMSHAVQGPGYPVGLNYPEICSNAWGEDAAGAHRAAAGMRSVLSGELKSFSIEYPNHTPTEQRWFLMTVTPLAYQLPNGAVVMHLDITEQKRSEEELHRFAAAMDATVDAIYLVDRSTMCFVHVNDAACRMQGLTREELLALGPDGVLSIPREELARTYDAIIASGMEASPLEMQRKRKDGSEVWVEVRRHALLAADRWMIVTLVRDVTERKGAQRSSMREKDFVTTLLDSLPGLFYLIDDQGRFVRWNKEFESVSGYSGEEVSRLNPVDLFPDSEKELIAGKIQEVFLTGQTTVEANFKAKDHTRSPYLFTGKRVEFEMKPHLIGMGIDITERKRAVQDLRDSEARFRSLTMLSSDWFWEQDAEHRFVAFSGGEGIKGWGPDQSKAVGLRRWDLGGVVPISCSWEEHRAVLDAHKLFRKFEYQRVLGDGRLQYVEASGEPVFDAEGRFTGYRGVATEITDRRIADNKIRDLNRVYAVLSGINALIVHARNRDDLFRDACRIAVETGGFHSVWIGVVDSASQRIVPEALAGEDRGLFASVKALFSSSEGGLQGNTLAAQAIRHKRAVVSNDSQNDPAVLFGKMHADFAVQSMAMLPLVIADQAVAVLALYARETNFFHAEELKLLTELAGNIAFAVDQIEKAKKLARITRVNAMLSGINGAIVRIAEPNELFKEVCRIAVSEGGFFIARAFERGSNGKVRIAASTDSELKVTLRIVDDFNADPEHCPNMLAIGFRTGKTLVSNDVANDTRMPHRAALTKGGTFALAALPIVVDKRVAALLVLHSQEPGMFDEAELRLLFEMVSNVSFALDHIEKETKVRRLTRVYAVLSGINTLIVRARDRDELFRETCQIAVAQGNFTMAWLGLLDRSAMTLVPVASAGATQDHLTLINQRFSLGVDAPLGNLFSAKAIREKKIAVSNDVQNDPDVLFKEEHAKRGSRSMAMLPLQIAGEVIGILALYSGEIGFFDEEELKLLNDLAGDVAFAIDNLSKQERLDYLAYYDVLTGLANRTLFLERVSQYIRSAVDGGSKLALFFLDLERFRNINDSLGRPAGDELLKQVADWLTHNVGDAGLLARLGADNFAILLPKLTADGDIARLLDRRIRTFLEHPFRVQGTDLQLSVKVGVALFPDDGADADTLLRNAEVALKKAKERGERYLFYKQKMNAAVAGKLTLENQLRQALENSEFVLHYQPKVNLENGELTSAEALIRWNDPRTGLVPPGRFIPILEETGLIYDVGRWALRQAIADYLRWRAAGLPAVRIAVNVSPLQLRNQGFIEEIRQVVGIDAAAAAGLELEITESLIMEDVKLSIASLQTIRAMGVTIAIDDFGTGFSSLSYLAKLPVDTLKIDRSFVIDMTAGPEGLALVSTIINLAHSLKLKVVAEGVETEEQSRLLRLLRCNEMQGFLFSKPVPADIFESKFLTMQTAPSASEVA